jgi:hypothetical protein
MSITKYYFTGSTIQNQNYEIGKFLTTYATDYFTDFVSYSNAVVCSIDGSRVLSFGTSDYSNILMTLKNGVDKSADAQTNSWEYAVACTGGIIFKSQVASAPASFHSYLYITKSNNNETIIAASMYANSYGHFFVGDVIKSSSWWDVFGTADYLYDQGYYSQYWGITSSMTALTPLVTNAGTYAPNLNIMRFTQFPQQEGKIVVNGIEYYSTGYLAMK